MSGEVPSLDSLLLLDVSLGGIILLLPFEKDLLPLLDDLDGVIWLLLKDLRDVDLDLHLITDLV